MQSLTAKQKQRRYDPWEEKKTLNLVKEHLICMDQLRALSVTFGRRILFFQNLRKDLDEIAAEDLKQKRAPKINNPDAETPQSRIEWALSHCHRNKTTIDLLLDDITRSVDTVGMIPGVFRHLQLTSLFVSYINCKRSTKTKCKSFLIGQTRL